MKYKVGDKVFLTDIGKGDAVRYGTIIKYYNSDVDGVVLNNRKRMPAQNIFYCVKLLSGNRAVTIEEEEILKIISDEEYNLIKIMLE